MKSAVVAALVVSLLGCVASSQPQNDAVADIIGELHKNGFPPLDESALTKLFAKYGGLAKYPIYPLGGRTAVAHGFEWRDASGKCFVEFEPASGGPVLVHGMRAGCGWRTKTAACAAVRRWLRAAGADIAVQRDSFCSDAGSEVRLGLTTADVIGFTKVFRNAGEWRSTVEIRQGGRLIAGD